MKLTVVQAVLIGTLVLACSSDGPSPVKPAPNIDATVDIRLKEEKTSQPTSIPSPTNTLPSKRRTLYPSATVSGGKVRPKSGSGG